MGVSTVIIKPTKFCQAGCKYCSAPPEVNGAPKWSVDDFKRIFDKLHPYMTDNGMLLWHGGEPMLLPPDFYWRTHEYAVSVKPGIVYAMQTNILAYASNRWKDLFAGPFNGAISTSFDPDETYREYKGSTSIYTKVFKKRLASMIEDGFHPKVIGTYTEETIHLAHQMYDWSLSLGEKCFDIRFNYRYPAGRDDGMGEMLRPDTYGRHLISLYDRWIADVPPFVITPLDEMLKKVIGLDAMRCPWTRHCGGHFLGIEPNGDVYNCSEFADMGDQQYRFGNIWEQTVPEIMMSKPAAQARGRRVNVPMDCKSCRHFNECEGGCMRDAVLYGQGLGGKFHYCRSWMMVFDHIKESIRTGAADRAVEKFGVDPEAARERLGYGRKAA
jgi:uncharacterized protein